MGPCVISIYAADLHCIFTSHLFLPSSLRVAYIISGKILLLLGCAQHMRVNYSNPGFSSPTRQEIMKMFGCNQLMSSRLPDAVEKFSKPRSFIFCKILPFTLSTFLIYLSQLKAETYIFEFLFRLCCNMIQLIK